MFLASFLSSMGSVIGMTAFAFYLLDRFSSQPFYYSLTEMMYSLPALAVFFIVGVLADRMDRQKIAFNCDWVRAVLSLVLIGTILIGWMPLVFVALFIRSAVGRFFAPAEQAIIQGILTENEYTTAAGLNMMTSSLFMLIGNGLGIFAYWFLGVQGAILIDALSFVVSGLLILSCHMDNDTRLPNGAHKLRDINAKMMLGDFKHGLAYTYKHRLLLSIIIGFFVMGAVNGAFSVIPLFILKYKLVPETYEQWSIWEGVIFGSGILIGSIFGSMIANKFKIYHLLTYSLLILGLLVGLIAFAGNITMYLTFIFAVALILPLSNIAIGGWLPKIVDKKMMGRVEGLISPIMMLSQTLALGAISILFPTILTIEGLIFVVSLLIVIVSIFYAFVLPRLSQKYDAEKASAIVPKAVTSMNEA